jgi:hypothetical protein
VRVTVSGASECSEQHWEFICRQEINQSRLQFWLCSSLEVQHDAIPYSVILFGVIMVEPVSITSYFLQ